MYRSRSGGEKGRKRNERESTRFASRLFNTCWGWMKMFIKRRSSTRNRWYVWNGEWVRGSFRSYHFLPSSPLFFSPPPPPVNGSTLVVERDWKRSGDNLREILFWRTNRSINDRKTLRAIINLRRWIIPRGWISLRLNYFSKSNETCSRAAWLIVAISR